MTDKQIIMTDKGNLNKGIGVTINNHACDVCGAYECNGNDCRLYQEYTAKVQEGERLRKDIANLLDLDTGEEYNFGNIELEIKELKQQLDQLKAENEELKKEIINRNKKIEELRFSVSDLTNRLCDLNAEKSFRIVDLEQTLAEIKKIAEILVPMTDEYENCYDRDKCFECDFTEDCSYFNTKRIIQICDEVINE